MENEEEQKMIESLNRTTKFLNEQGKEYEIKYWDSLEGLDIILTDFNLVFVINQSGYLTFEDKKENELKVNKLEKKE